MQKDLLSERNSVLYRVLVRSMSDTAYLRHDWIETSAIEGERVRRNFVRMIKTYPLCEIQCCAFKGLSLGSATEYDEDMEML